MGKSNRLPDGWIDYVPVGQRLHGTRFIAFKVPLKRIFDTKLSPAQRFSPMDLIRNIKAQKEELGLIIDLTCTTRYYEPEELPKTLRYSKIFTVGQEIPDSKTIRRFKSVVMQFLSENADNDKLIGVHCTHGLNRTGYLICRYLIDEQGMDPDEAIELFNGSRGHSIERQNYILDLQGKPVTNAHDRDTAGPVLHRAQKYISNGKPSHRADYDWNHPHHAPSNLKITFSKSRKDNLPYGQFLRIRKNCARKRDFDTEAQILTDKLKSTGYPNKVIRKAKKLAWYNIGGSSSTPHPKTKTQISSPSVKSPTS